MAVNYEKLNILIDGNYITNQEDLIRAINELTYEFNTREYLELMANNLRYSNLSNKDELEDAINLKLFEFLNIEAQADKKVVGQVINRGDFNNLLTKQNTYNEELSTLEKKRLNMYVEILLTKEADHTITEEEQGLLNAYVNPLLSIYDDALEVVENHPLDDITMRQIRSYLANRESLHNKYKKDIPTLKKEYHDRDFSNGVANVIILLSIGIIAIFAIMILSLAK